MNTRYLDQTIQQAQATYPDRPELESVGRLALDILRVQREELDSLDRDVPSPEENIVSSRIAAREPALQFHDLHLDPENLHTLWDRFVQLVTERGVLTTAESQMLLSEAEPTDRLIRITELWYDQGANDSISLRSDLTPELVSMSARPWLFAAADRVAALIQSERWVEAYCPACGGEPDLLVITADRSSIYLCSRCDSTWLQSQNICPFCGESGSALEYYPGSVAGHQLRLCSNCNRALKIVDQTRFETQITPQAERLYALDLDRVATELNATT